MLKQSPYVSPYKQRRTYAKMKSSMGDPEAMKTNQSCISTDLKTADEFIIGSAEHSNVSSSRNVPNNSLKTPKRSVK